MTELGALVQHEDGRTGRLYFPKGSTRPAGKVFVRWYDEPLRENEKAADYVSKHELGEQSSLVKTENLRMVAYIHER